MKYDISAKDMKAKLESLPTIGTVSVEREVYSYGFSWLITFESNLGDLPLLTIDSEPSAGFALSGTDVQLQVTHLHGKHTRAHIHER